MGSDQCTPAHNIIYKDFDKGLKSELVQSYRRIAKQWLDNLEEAYGIKDWAIQRYPSVRIHLPGNVSVFEFHRDSDYCHPLGEINHFISLTHSTGTASLHIEHNLGWSDFKPLVLQKNQSAIINTSIFKHGDMLNMEGYTRVSIDFRGLPEAVLNETKTSHSITKKRRFDCNDYFISSARLLQE